MIHASGADRSSLIDPLGQLRVATQRRLFMTFFSGLDAGIGHRECYNQLLGQKKKQPLDQGRIISGREGVKFRPPS